MKDQPSPVSSIKDEVLSRQASKLIKSLRERGYLQEDVYRGSSVPSRLQDDVPALHTHECIELLSTHISSFIETWTGIAIMDKRSHLALEALPENEQFMEALLESVAKTGAAKRLVAAMALDHIQPLGKGRKRETDVQGYALFPETIRYVQQALDAMHERKRPHVNFEAETQWGKTIAMVLTKMMHVLYLETNGITDEVVIMINTNRINTAEQMADDNASAEALYDKLRYVNGIGSKRRPSMGAALQDHRDTSIIEKNADAIKNSKFNESTLEKLREAAPQMLENGKKIITMLVDEGDERSGVNSKHAEIVRELNQMGLRVREVLFSATTYPYKRLGEFRHIKVVIPKDSGYCGTVQGVRTPVRSFQHIPVADVDLIDAKLYDGEKFNETLDKIKTREKRGRSLVFPATANMRDPLRLLNYPTLAKYQKFVENKFVELFDAIASGEMFDKHGPFNGGTGAMVRFGQSGTKMNDLLDKVETRLNAMGIGIVRFYTNMSDSSLSKSIDDIQTKFPYYIVAVLHAGRRADRFKRSCTVFIDFTRDLGNMTAMEQGTLGRASGWFKINDDQSTYVLVHQRNYELVKRFRALYDRFGIKVPLKNAGAQAIKIDDDLDLEQSTSFTIDFDGAHGRNPYFRELQAEITAKVADRLDFKRRRVKVNGKVFDFARSSNATLDFADHIEGAYGHVFREMAAYFEKNVALNESGERAILRNIDNDQLNWFDLMGIVGDVTGFNRYLSKFLTGDANMIRLLAPGVVRNDGKFLAVHAADETIAWCQVRSTKGRGGAKEASRNTRRGSSATKRFSKHDDPNALQTAIIMDRLHDGSVKASQILLHFDTEYTPDPANMPAERTSFSVSVKGEIKGDEITDLLDEGRINAAIEREILNPLSFYMPMTVRICSAGSSLGKEDDGVLSLQFAVEPKTKTFVLTKMRIPLEEATTLLTGVNADILRQYIECLPNQTSHYYTYTTPEEKALIASAKAAKKASKSKSASQPVVVGPIIVPPVAPMPAPPKAPGFVPTVIQGGRV